MTLRDLVIEGHRLTLRLPRAVRYVFAGGTAAFTDLVILYGLTDLAGMWYLVSQALAFIAAFCVSFTLQKFWTFEDYSLDRLHRQLPAYFAVGIANLGINTGLMYALVDLAGIWYIAAQVIATLLIAVWSFVIYRLIFHVEV